MEYMASTQLQRMSAEPQHSCYSLRATVRGHGPMVAIPDRSVKSIIDAIAPIANRISHAVKGFYRASSALAVYAMVVCLSVRVSVCPSQVGVLLKWLNIGKRKQRHTIAQGL